MNIQVSQFDTNETIKNKIAVKLDTLPSFINVKQVSPLEYTLLTTELKTLDYSSDDFVVKLKKLNANLNELALEYLILKKINVDNPEVYDIFEIYRELNSTNFGSETALKNELRIYSEGKKKLIAELREKVKLESELLKKLDCESEIKATKFIQDTEIKTWELKTESDSLEIFNSIKLSETIPFVKLITPDNQYYKLSQNSTLPPNPELEKAVPENKIYFYNTEMEIICEISFDSLLPTITIFESSLENIIKGSIDSKIEYSNEKISGVRGNFALKDVTLNREIFLYLILNNPQLANYFYVDESKKIGPPKRHEGGVIHLFFGTPNLESTSSDISTFVSQKTAMRSDKFFQNKVLELYTNYLNVRISKADDISQVKRFIKAFETLICLYSLNFEVIKKEYSKYIPSFKNVTNEPSEYDNPELKKLQMSNPDLFIEGYRRKCSNYPSVYEKGDTNSKGKKVLEYPKGSGKYYYCDYKDYPYLGLTQNKMDNSDEFPYYPCCYATDKNQKVWEKYLADEETIKVSKTKSSKLIDRKALKYLQNGKLPKNIYYILGGNFYRTGVAFGSNSFIHAVMLAVDPNYLSKKIQENPEEYVTNFRQNLAKSITPIRQQTNLENINQMLLDPKTPFDSKIFVNYLSWQYNINIFIFERITDPNATFEIPDYTLAFLNNYSPEKQTVIIYKHYGTAGDNLKTPHYELIRTKELTKFDSEVYKKLKGYFDKVYRVHSIKSTSTSESNFFTKLMKPCGQYIDHLGKVRGVCLEFSRSENERSENERSEKIFVETSPLPIFNKVREIKPFKNERKLAELFVKQHKFEYESENGGIVITNYLDYFYIPITESQGESDLICWGDSDDGVLKAVENTKRTANFMMQYALWAFSEFVKDDKITENKIDEFIKTTIVIKKVGEYTTPRKFTKNSSFFVKSKLVVDSKNTLKKLKYWLQLNVNNNYDNTKEYYKKVYLENYYDNSKYFTKQEGVLIFIGKNSLTSWLTRSDPTKYVVYQIDPEIKTPQFFVNWSLGDKPIIAQNAESKEQAVYFSKKFDKYGINLYGVSELKGSNDPAVEFSLKGVLTSDTQPDNNKPWIYSNDSENWTALLK